MPYLGHRGTDVDVLQEPDQEVSDAGPGEDAVGAVQHDHNVQRL